MKEVGFKLDNWQKQVLEHEGNITIRAGRQVGKSTIIGIYVGRYMKKHPDHTVLVIAASLKQAGWLFEKILGEINLLVQRGELELEKDPTKTEIAIKGGGKVLCLPAGKTGNLIRGLTIDVLIGEEAAYIPEIVWTSVLPMLAVSRKVRGRGWIILLSTPFGKGGYFFDSFGDPEFKSFHLSSEDCPRIPKSWLEKEKKRLSREMYAQEYLGEFIDDYRQLFSTELIKKCAGFIEWSFEKEYDRSKRYYMGVDVARYGGDENAFVIAEMDNKKMIKIVKVITSTRKPLTDTIGHIKKLHDKFGFRKIFIDDGGIGGGLTDVLIESLGRVVVGLNNAKRSVDKEQHQKGILKEDLYSNALLLMEAGKINMINDVQLMGSLKNVTFEYTSDKNIKISGRKSHCAEAFVRACWCMRDVGYEPMIA